MKRLLLFASALVLFGAAGARANTTFNMHPTPKPPEVPAPDPKPVIVGVATTSGVILAGLWLSRRRTQTRG